ncbi:hypothetical protein ACVW0Q_002549 [Thermostichus sp. MS-CIW-21]|jgi:hypothetical protein|nr:hypothetical protein SYN65AY6A5_13390 [Synechococcus sp. 65AY6A5]PIK96497.1 hypothetical protein SYN60AY4M2_10525 [Synechococcus sp. 60AY4M2]PIK99096.1 hypothetical protein SYN63AY4M1_07920 [Synechococcus sp. 63AY4M1]PIL02459.1 hypothetical protein SYN65AY640_06145 [Synechococcus sp. 65AY640]
MMSEITALEKLKKQKETAQGLPARNLFWGAALAYAKGERFLYTRRWSRL